MPTLTRTSPIFKSRERELEANLEPPSGGARPQRQVPLVASLRGQQGRRVVAPGLGRPRLDGVSRHIGATRPLDEIPAVGRVLEFVLIS